MTSFGRRLATRHRRNQQYSTEKPAQRGTRRPPLRLNGRPMTRTSAFLVALGALTICGCTSPVQTTDPFEATGETVAFSGGEAGPDSACSTCHGPRGQGDGNLAPRLAGLDEGYALRQLENFASGARRNPQMQRIARRLDPQAREKVAKYYASLPPQAASATPGTDCAGAAIYHEGIPSRGIAACASCHGAGGQADASNPPLTAQPVPYLAHQLDAWAKGERYGDGGGVMRTISRALHPVDRQAVADYASRLGDARDGQSIRATCLRRHRPDR